MLPTDVIAHDMAGTAFYASIVGDRDLVLFPLEHVCWTDPNADEVEGTFDAHLRIFDP